VHGKVRIQSRAKHLEKRRIKTMKISKSLAACFIGAGILLSGCGERTEGLAEVDKNAVPPLPVIPPEQIGASVGGEGPATAVPPHPIPGVDPVQGINTTDIMDRPELYLGRVVTVVSEVEGIFTPWSFKLDESQMAAGGVDSDLLVVGAIPLPNWGFDETWKNEKVKVTGTVRILQAEDFRRDYGRGVDDLLFRRYEGKPVVVARDVEKVS
jgi:hypothetical protein